MTGFPLRWPTLVTLLIHPEPIAIRVRRAIGEDREAATRFGGEPAAWRARAPGCSRAAATRRRRRRDDGIATAPIRG